MLPGVKGKSRPTISVGDFFRHLDQDFIGISKVVDEDFVYKCTDVLVQSVLEVPIIVQWPEATVEFEFHSKLGDINFGVVFVAAPEEDCEVSDEDVVTIVDTERYGSYDEPVTGRFTPPCEGVLFFIWDNAHDWTSVKKVTYTVRVHQPSFSLVDRIRCEAAQEQLSPLIDELNDDHNRRDDARNAARNQAASASFLALQIDKLQQRLAQRQTQLERLADEEAQLRSRVALAAAAGDGLRLRTLTRGVLLCVLSFLPYAADAPCAQVCSYWAALCAELRLHRGDEAFVAAELREQRRVGSGGGGVLSKAQRHALLITLRSGRHAPGDSQLPAAGSAEAAVSRTASLASLRSERHNRRIIRVPSSDAARPLQRSLSRTHSTSRSRSPGRASVSSASSVASDSQRRVATRPSGQRSRAEVASDAERSSTLRSSASSSASSPASLQIRRRREALPVRPPPASPPPVSPLPPDDAWPSRLTRKTPLLLSPDPLPPPPPKPPTLASRAPADGRHSDDEPNVRRVGFTATAASQMRAASAAAPQRTAGREELRRDEAKDAAVRTAPRGHRKPKMRELEVPAELRGRVVSLGEASRLLPSLTSHPHLLQDAPPPAQARESHAGGLPLRPKGDPTAADADERRRKQLRDFVVHGAQRIDQLSTEKRRLKRLIRSWHRVEAQLCCADTALIDADGIRPIDGDAPTETPADASHGELRALHEKYRQVSLGLRISAGRLSEFLRRVPAEEAADQWLPPSVTRLLRAAAAPATRQLRRAATDESPAAAPGER